MTPIEAMAKARYEAWRVRIGSKLPWEKYHELMKAAQVADMRAALLAGAELSKQTLFKGSYALNMFKPGTNDAILAQESFRAIIRSLAEGGEA
jgi:hypothetical protein